MNEEHTSIAPSTEQAENERDARAEELQSTFSYDGYQVVRKELFAHLRDPAIVIRKDSITFNTACITGLEDVVYIHVMRLTLACISNFVRLLHIKIMNCVLHGLDLSRT